VGWLQAEPAGSELRQAIQKILLSKDMSGIRVGIFAKSLTSQKTMIDINGSGAFIPASVNKLFTTSAVLARLGSNFKYKTRIYAANQPQHGTIPGDLYIRGSGDPALVIEYVALIASRLAGEAGIKEVDGSIVIDTSYFDDKSYPDTWSNTETLRAFHAPLSAFSANFNAVRLIVIPGGAAGQAAQLLAEPNIPYIELANEVTTVARKTSADAITFDRVDTPNGERFRLSGTIGKDDPPRNFYRAVAHPERYGGEMLRAFLKKEGVVVKGKTVLGRIPATVVPILEFESVRDMATIIRDINKFSNNFSAEHLTKTLGAEILGTPGTTAKGCQVITDFLEKAGLKEPTFTMVDGSGLSRENRASPRQLVNLLTFMAQDFRLYPEFISSLSIARVDGTLKSRLKNYDLTGKIRAKTGSIDGVSCLAGYLERADKEIWAFAIMLNGENRTSYDKIVSIIDQLCYTLQKE
jgi:D-alanyl-D-alanine carboxypeptidase/D-alanyl-D-alanine-endopeptidase (penicillin-binding protein 4)